MNAMKSFSYLAFLVLFSSLLFLSACQSTNSKYSAPVWQYEPDTKQRAQERPNPLADTYNEGVNKADLETNPYFAGHTASEALDGTPHPNNNTNEYSPEFANAQNSQVNPYTYNTQQRPDLPPVKVALLVPLSGKNKDLGQALLNAAQLALFDIGHNTFELIPRDTQGTPQGARKAAQDAVQNGAQLVLGPVFASSVRAAKNITSAAGINMVAFSTDWSLADRTTFIMGFLPFDQVSRIVNYTARQGITNIGVFAPNNTYGDAVVSAYNNTAFRAGLNTIELDRFSPSNSSLSYYMRQFANWDQRKEGEIPAPYEAIFMPVGGDTARSLGNFASQYGMPPKSVRRIGTGLMDDESLSSEIALEGTWFAAPSPDLRDKFNRKYFETFGVSPPRLSTLSYDATALAAVLARTGLESTGYPAFDIDSIMNPNGFIGVDGIFRFRQGGLVERGLAVLEYKEGTIAIIDPAPNTFENHKF